MEDKALHDGHRQRMRERIEKNGLSSLQPHEVLEYLLFSFIPRRDTNELAHRLINEFGSFGGVLNADPKHLAAVKGMTENAAFFLSNLPAVFRMYVDDIDSKRKTVKGRGAARQYLGNKLYGQTVEVAFVAALDAHEQLIACVQLGEGTGDRVEPSVRKIVDVALKYKASGILLAHNHPSGDPKPSSADSDMTYQLLITLSSVGVKLLDHFIFSGSSYYSFDENGLLAGMSENAKTMLKEGIYFYE